MPQFIGSTTPLAGGATYTSKVVLTDAEFDLFTGTVFADQGGTLNIDQGGDGVHFDHTDTISVTANTGASFQVTIISPYLRIRYVNGGTPQTVFRLYPRWRFNTTI